MCSTFVFLPFYNNYYYFKCSQYLLFVNFKISNTSNCSFFLYQFIIKFLSKIIIIFAYLYRSLTFDLDLKDELLLVNASFMTIFMDDNFLFDRANHSKLGKTKSMFYFLLDTYSSLVVHQPCIMQCNVFREDIKSIHSASKRESCFLRNPRLSQQLAKLTFPFPPPV